MAAMRAEGRLGDEMYLTQFAFEEAKHTQVFRLWLDAVGVTDDLQVFLDDLPTYRKIFYEELPESLDTLATDPSPAAQVRASATYNHVIEGMMALTGYYAWHRICVDNNILPGHAGDGPPHRRRRASSHGLGHVHLPAPCRRGRLELGGVRGRG